MKELVVKFGGKVWEGVKANNSGWIAPGAPADLVEALKVAPRAGYTSKNCPIVKDDNGNNLYLGAAELHQENEAIGGNSSGTGPKVSLVMPESVLLDFLKFKNKLEPETQKFLDAEKEKLDKQKEAEKAKKEQSLKNLNPDLDLENLSKDQLKALETLGFKF